MKVVNMGKVISIVGQKGGGSKVPKPEHLLLGLLKLDGRLIWRIDTKQQTSLKWTERRENNGLSQIDCALYRRDTAVKMKDSCHLLIIDGRPAAETTSLDVADESDLVIITTGTTIDDLEPSLELARELIKKGIEKNKIVFIVAKSPSQSQGEKAQKQSKRGASKFSIQSFHSKPVTARLWMRGVPSMKLLSNP
jgi:chromosome partitioning protein